MSHEPDRWPEAAGYERYMGRWSRPVAQEFVVWLAAPAGARWLDAGCGTGVLCAAALEGGAAREVLGLDRALPLAAAARSSLAGRAARVAVADAQALPARDRDFDLAVSGLVLNLVPEPGLMLSEMARVVRPGGTVAVYVWDYAVGMELLRRFWEVAVALDPAADRVDQRVCFPICNRPALTDLFESVGFRGVETHAIDVPTAFRDFADYWESFERGEGRAPEYVRSLGAPRREHLREDLRRRLPAAADGSIVLTARAWAVRGLRAL
jgi:SAM-dependent methyltransferase